LCQLIYTTHERNALVLLVFVAVLCHLTSFYS
jgi:hypothetical protein